MNIAPIEIKPAAAGRSKTTGPTGHDGSFLSMLGKAQQSGIEKMKFNQPRAFQAGGEKPEKDFQTCMAALRSGLLSKGKPFGQVHVSREDAHLLKDFLGHCGYSREAGDQLIADLLAASPKGEIAMSRFLAKVRAAGAPRKMDADDITLDVSMVPYVESLLKGFAFSEEEIGSILNNRRAANGGIDLENLIQNLKAAGQKALRDSRGVVDLHTSPQVAETLESLGIKVPEGNSAGRITILDFISTLKQAAEKIQEANPGAGAQAAIHLNLDDLKNLNLEVTRHASQRAAMERASVPGDTLGHPEIPAEVSESIHRILEKATASDQTDEDLTAIIKNSKIKFDDPESKKIGVSRRMEGDKAAADAQKETLTAVKGDGKPSGMPSVEEIKPVAGQSADPGLNDAMDPKASFDKSMARVLDMPLDGAHSKAPAAAHGLDPKPQPTGTILPYHVMDQLGRQISRSLARGDGIVQLRLKPSELGTVRLEMQMTDNRMHISVAAENGAVKELLLANVQELKEMLLGQGIRLDKLDVQVGDDFRQAFSDLNEGDGKEHSSRGGESGKPSYAHGDDDRDALFKTKGLFRHDAIVDLVA